MKNYKIKLTILILILILIGLFIFLYYNNLNKVGISDNTESNNNDLFIEKTNINFNSLPQEDE